jgi:adenosylhomocysteine nucleosidase
VIALFGALRPEVSLLQKRMVLEQAIIQPHGRLFKGKHSHRDILLLQTGMGQEKAERAARFVLERYPFTALISFGFAGALSRELKAGDLILCRKLHCGARPVVAEACYSDSGLLTLAGRAGIETGVRLHQGSSVTVARLAAKSQEKRVLGLIFGAEVVDMESYWLARLASARKIPFLAVRAISDTLTQSLPPFDRFLNADGELLWPETILYFLAHPEALAKLYGVYVNMRQARTNLTSFLEALIPRL